MGKGLFVFISCYFVQIGTLFVPQDLSTKVNTGLLISVLGSK